jgi:ATP-dependent DNA helicase RecG
VAAISVIPISDVQASKVLATEEGHFADIKGLDLTPAKMTRSTSAFANADGGEFFIGIDEAGSGGLRVWRGFRNPEAANAHVQVIEELFPLGDGIDLDFLSSAGRPGLVLHVTVHKTRDIKKSSDGTVYLRRGAQNLPLHTQAALRQLELNKGIVSFESETLPISLALITNSEAVIRFLLEVIPTAEPEPFLNEAGTNRRCETDRRWSSSFRG